MLFLHMNRKYPRIFLLSECISTFFVDFFKKKLMDFKR